jgi:amino acid transporter
MSQEKLSLQSAIFINLNIMISSGVFVNAVMLSQKIGPMGWTLYPLVGLCMLPLIAAIATLLETVPTGGFYNFAKTGIHDFWGFVSAWSYFTGKLASCALMLYVASTFLQQLIPSLQAISTITLACIILSLFTLLNILNIAINVSIQQFFLTAKGLAVFFVIAAGIMLFKSDVQFLAILDYGSIISTIPLVLYSLTGFEASCSLSRRIENPAKNAPKAVYFSFFIALLLYSAFQFLVYNVLQEHALELSGYKDLFPFLTTQLDLAPWISTKLLALLNTIVGLAALGGAYGVLFSNTWNLYELAHNGHLVGSSWFTHKNAYAIPVLCVFAQAAVCIFYLLTTSGMQLPLQQTASLGVTMAYTLSAISLLFLHLKQKKNTLIPLLAIITCCLFIYACIQSFILNGITNLYYFVGMLLLGICMYLITKK